MDVVSGAEPKRRRRSPKGEARRRQILDVALRIFSRDGFQNAAIATIAEEAGLTLPGLLHHFPSKVDLLLAILDRRDLEGHALIDDGKGHWRTLLQGLCDLNRRNATIPEVVRAFSVLNSESLLDEHPARQWFLDRAHRVRAQFSSAIASGIAAGEIRPGTDPDRIANQIIAMMDGLQILWLRAPDAIDLIATFDDYVARLVATLENPLA